MVRLHGVTLPANAVKMNGALVTSRERELVSVAHHLRADDPVRLRVRERLEDHGVHDAEHRRRGADTKCERQDRGDGKQQVREGVVVQKQYEVLGVEPARDAAERSREASLESRRQSRGTPRDHSNGREASALQSLPPAHPPEWDAWVAAAR